MNREQFKGKWNEIKGKLKEKWGRLTNDEILQIHGEYDKLVGALQKKYGYMKESAEEEIRNWNWNEKKESHGHRERHSIEEGMDRDEIMDEGRAWGFDRNEGQTRGMKDENRQHRKDEWKEKKRKAG